MLDYDKEAARYDASRGGEPRAAAAAEAVLSLVPPDTCSLLDVGCGTGIVTRRLAAARDGMRVTGVDLALAMARQAAARLPGAVVLADSRRLPFRDGEFDAVSSVWLLHLAAGPAEVRTIVGECARVLRPGGVYVTTVDKAASHNVGSDIDVLLSSRPPSPVRDGASDVVAHAAGHGLVPAGQACFRGHGQGRSPRRTVADLRRGWFVTLPPGDPLADGFATRLAELPDQDRPRPDPVFTLRAFWKPMAPPAR
ncbi:methyltransferase [Streptomyces violarus]|uniref:SAM-dependent methyltransferase n=1 Tax=Streptomyces violarus TaxID=67380 RepID=A0A7W4ZLS6_9ACTN|nr:MULTISPECIES: class I SAM-dependent methyltransferase [Streptomyces]MBB3074751.1 SAM-dependent methyltransferase [Streptomyces violarus]WRT97411.1 class I SAM-dependent methyltransferase [Streptomyces sp. CGMCC 4.1772]GHD00650.1 methyltransferase [Streptomyces violarus]